MELALNADSSAYFQYYYMGNTAASNSYYFPAVTTMPPTWGYTTWSHQLMTDIPAGNLTPSVTPVRNDLLDGLVGTLKELIEIITMEENEEAVLVGGDWDESFIDRSLRDMKALAYDKISNIVGGKRSEIT